jgi:L-iditol 2-dehydrogenase
MQAAVLYGPSRIAVETLPIPDIGPGDVLVRVAAATTCGTDLKVYLQGRHARMLTPPAVFGHEFSGTVAAVGSQVRGFEPGIRVVSNNSAPCGSCFYCGRGQPNLCDDLVFINGAYADYVAVPARIVRTNLLRLPDDLPFPVACITEPLACVLHCLDLAAFAPGDTVAVNGDGPSGLMLAAMARRRGARVILCGRAPQRLQVAQEFGIEQLVNHAEVPDQVEAVRALTEAGRGADVAIEAVGRPDVWETTTAMVRKGGQAIFYGGPPGGTSMRVDAPALHYDQITLQGVFHNTPAHVAQALDILDDPMLPWTSLLSTTLPLACLSEAFELMMARKALKVVIATAPQPGG